MFRIELYKNKNAEKFMFSLRVFIIGLGVRTIVRSDCVYDTLESAAAAARDLLKYHANNVDATYSYSYNGTEHY